MLTLEQGSRAVQWARGAVEAAARGQRLPEGLEGTDGIYGRPAGVFVTLKRSGLLRGCIGIPEPRMALARALGEAARGAAREDPRFPPLSPGELEDLEVEVTVLSPPVALEGAPRDYPKRVEVGRHGLLVRRGPRGGLLLPQVPVEQGWDAEEFLCQTCMKAGLPPDAWLAEGTRVSVFEGRVFSQPGPRLDVREVFLKAGGTC
ncbi:MAG: TIGR00296 family protein [Euryarchaeota archaeon]|nr:TIGR00296 family protein [Euryarchaeota archaeon]